MPGDFNAMIHQEGKKVVQLDKAFRIADVYVKLSHAGKVLILKQAADIPYIKKHWKDPQQYQTFVKPPRSQRVEGGYRLDLSWSEIGGRLEEVVFLVK